MKQYTVRQTIMISEKQANTLNILKLYNINISQFIRESIREKIYRDWKFIKEKQERIKIPF